VQVIPIAQRVGGERGSATWAGALFAFGLMDRLYRQFEPESGIAILRSDGTALLLRVTGEAYPYEGGSIADSELFRRASEGPESGVLEGPGPYRPIAIIAAYVRLHGFPIMAAASRPRSVALAAWLGRRRATLWLTAISSLVLVAMTGLIGYFVSALRRRDRHYSTLFNNAAFSAFVLEGERFKEANRTTARMFGVEDARALRGKTPWDVSPALQPDGKPSEERAREQINRALAVGSTPMNRFLRRLICRACRPAARRSRSPSCTMSPSVSTQTASASAPCASCTSSPERWLDCRMRSAAASAATSTTRPGRRSRRSNSSSNGSRSAPSLWAMCNALWCMNAWSSRINARARSERPRTCCIRRSSKRSDF
jgi:hypothetical protein